MLRREFLQSLATFAAAAAAGGTVAKAGFTAPSGPAIPEPAVWTPPPPAIGPGIVNLTVVRGEELRMDFDCTDVSLPMHEVGWWVGRLSGQAEQIKGQWTGFRLHAAAEQTARMRPGVVPWGIAIQGRIDGTAPQTLITGLATILPDAFWKSQEEVLGWLPRMHALGVERPRGSRGEQVWFRERLRPDERSIEDDRVASILTHSRPVGATIINRGAGCVIDFAKEELL